MITKQGAHGTLYRYVVEYTDDDPGFGVAHWHCWAYNTEHAIDKFFDDDDGFRPLRIARAGEPAHRLNWHEV